MSRKNKVSKKKVKEVLKELTGDKTSDQIQKEVSEGKWPFAISEEQMRREVEEMFPRRTKES